MGVLFAAFITVIIVLWTFVAAANSRLEIPCSLLANSTPQVPMNVTKFLSDWTDDVNNRYADGVTLRFVNCNLTTPSALSFDTRFDTPAPQSDVDVTVAFESLTVASGTAGSIALVAVDDAVANVHIQMWNCSVKVQAGQHFLSWTNLQSVHGVSFSVMDSNISITGDDTGNGTSAFCMMLGGGGGSSSSHSSSSSSKSVLSIFVNNSRVISEHSPRTSGGSAIVCAVSVVVGSLPTMGLADVDISLLDSAVDVFSKGGPAVAAAVLAPQGANISRCNITVVRSASSARSGDMAASAAIVGGILWSESVFLMSESSSLFASGSAGVASLGIAMYFAPSIASSRRRFDIVGLIINSHNSNLTSLGVSCTVAIGVFIWSSAISTVWISNVSLDVNASSISTQGAVGQCSVGLGVYTTGGETNLRRVSQIISTSNIASSAKIFALSGSSGAYATNEHDLTIAEYVVSLLESQVASSSPEVALSAAVAVRSKSSASTLSALKIIAQRCTIRSDGQLLPIALGVAQYSLQPLTFGNLSSIVLLSLSCNIAASGGEAVGALSIVIACTNKAFPSGASTLLLRNVSMIALNESKLVAFGRSTAVVLGIMLSTADVGTVAATFRDIVISLNASRADVVGVVAAAVVGATLMWTGVSYDIMALNATGLKLTMSGGAMANANCGNLAVCAVLAVAAHSLLASGMKTSFANMAIIASGAKIAVVRAGASSVVASFDAGYSSSRVPSWPATSGNVVRLCNVSFATDHASTIVGPSVASNYSLVVIAADFQKGMLFTSVPSAVRLASVPSSSGGSFDPSFTLIAFSSFTTPWTLGWKVPFVGSGYERDIKKDSTALDVTSTTFPFRGLVMSMVADLDGHNSSSSPDSDDSQLLAFFDTDEAAITLVERDKLAVAMSQPRTLSLPCPILRLDSVSDKALRDATASLLRETQTVAPAERRTQRSRTLSLPVTTRTPRSRSVTVATMTTLLPSATTTTTSTREKPPTQLAMPVTSSPRLNETNISASISTPVTTIATVTRTTHAATPLPPKPTPLVGSNSETNSSAPAVLSDDEQQQAATAFGVVATVSAMSSFVAPSDAMQSARLFSAFRVLQCNNTPAIIVPPASGDNRTLSDGDTPNSTHVSPAPDAEIRFPRSLLPMVRIGGSARLGAIAVNVAAVALTAMASLGAAAVVFRGGRGGTLEKCFGAARFPSSPIAVALFTCDGTFFCAISTLLVPLSRTPDVAAVIAAIGVFIPASVMFTCAATVLCCPLVFVKEGRRREIEANDHTNVTKRLVTTLLRLRGSWQASLSSIVSVQRGGDMEMLCTVPEQPPTTTFPSASDAPKYFLAMHRCVIVPTRGGPGIRGSLARFSVPLDAAVTLATSAAEAWGTYSCPQRRRPALAQAILSVLVFLYLLVVAPHPSPVKAALTATSAALAATIAIFVFVAVDSADGVAATVWAQRALTAILVASGFGVVNTLATLVTTLLRWRTRRKEAKLTPSSAAGGVSLLGAPNDATTSSGRDAHTISDDGARIVGGVPSMVRDVPSEAKHSIRRQNPLMSQ